MTRTTKWVSARLLRTCLMLTGVSWVACNNEHRPPMDGGTDAGDMTGDAIVEADSSVLNSAASASINVTLTLKPARALSASATVTITGAKGSISVPVAAMGVNPLTREIKAGELKKVGSGPATIKVTDQSFAAVGGVTVYNLQLNPAARASAGALSISNVEGVVVSLRALPGQKGLLALERRSPPDRTLWQYQITGTTWDMGNQWASMPKMKETTAKIGAQVGLVSAGKLIGFFGVKAFTCTLASLCSESNQAMYQQSQEFDAETIRASASDPSLERVAVAISRGIFLSDGTAAKATTGPNDSDVTWMDVLPLTRDPSYFALRATGDLIAFDEKTGAPLTDPRLAGVKALSDRAGDKLTLLNFAALDPTTGAQPFAVYVLEKEPKKVNIAVSANGAYQQVHTIDVGETITALSSGDVEGTSAPELLVGSHRPPSMANSNSIGVVRSYLNQATN